MGVYVYMTICVCLYDSFVGVRTGIDVCPLPPLGMEAMSCDRKEVLQDLVGNVGHLYVAEGPFGRIRARDKTQTCEHQLEASNTIKFCW